MQQSMIPAESALHNCHNQRVGGIFIYSLTHSYSSQHFMFISQKLLRSPGTAGSYMIHNRRGSELLLVPPQGDTSHT